MNRFLSVLCCAALVAGCTNFSGKVRLSGNIEDYNGMTVTLQYDGAESMISDSSIVLNVSPDGSFDTTIVLDKPTYFKIIRNTVYLTPGDDLVCRINNDSRRSSFSGTGSEANNYLIRRTFPKGGSFLASGRNVKQTFEETRETVLGIAEARRTELLSCEGLAVEFVEMEEARIDADIVNSFLSFPSYLRDFYSGIEPGDVESMNMKLNEFHSGIKDELLEYTMRINDDRFADVECVRLVMIGKVMSERYSGLFEGVQPAPLYNDLKSVSSITSMLGRKIDPETLVSVENLLSGISNEDFRKIAGIRLESVKSLLPGSPAIDIMMTDSSGKEINLSDYKGKVIYMDFWATWCGPCKGQAPYFEKLAKEYEGKDIVFLSVSIDSDREAWLEYVREKDGVQLHTFDSAVGQKWQVASIPRFILVDRDFKIVDSYAMRPSDEKIRGILDKHVGV